MFFISVFMRRGYNRAFPVLPHWAFFKRPIACLGITHKKKTPQIRGVLESSNSGGKAEVFSEKKPPIGGFLYLRLSGATIVAPFPFFRIGQAGACTPLWGLRPQVGILLRKIITHVPSPNLCCNYEQVTSLALEISFFQKQKSSANAELFAL